MNLSIQGHAYTRRFSYTENGIYNEFDAPGGAALVAQILSRQNAAEYQPLGGAYRREHLTLQLFEDKQRKISYYAIGGSAGAAAGETLLPPAPLAAPCAVVWDEGFGALAPPADIPVLWASNKVLPDREAFAKIAGRCFLLMDADVLRSGGAMISRQVSWERTATELIWQIKNNPALAYLNKAPHILITFAEDGAVCLERKNGELSANLTLAHGGGEGVLRDKTKGRIPDAFAVMAASAALQFPAVISGEKALRVHSVLKSAEGLMGDGYTIEQLRDGAFDLAEIAGAPETSFAIPLAPGQNAIDPDLWCIGSGASNKRIFDLAYDYVLEGANVIAGLPQLSFGALTTIDRWEIESYQNIRNLIVGYAGGDSVRPLSIAVFGSPGSGKSFGVTQIAKNVLPGKVEKLEFNVSQLSGAADLGAAFQKVRDAALDGKLPLVFFDEFDSGRDGLPLGWVKSFLMPMQDGKFKDDSGEHPLGKCILVFAGGTAASFEEFIGPMSSKDAAEQQAFKNIKGPDFVSRLRGTINVLGPNPKDGNDKNYILRRALLLRSLCERKLDMKKGGAPISENILWAMLLVPKYRHGARSMEAILDMSRIEGNVWEPVSLPFYSQLSLHVDADAFIKLVLREVILNSYAERFAIQIADYYTEKYPGAPYSRPWGELPENIRESNRHQARSFAKFLAFAGFSYDAGDTPFASVGEFSKTEIELLSEQSHIEFVIERTADGWKQGGKTDRDHKISALLIPWGQLPEDEKEKDRDIVRKLIPMMKSIGLRVYRAV
jgi:hypothetical protein